MVRSTSPSLTTLSLLSVSVGFLSRTRLGSMAAAIFLASSTSKPSISPVSVLRDAKPRVFSSTPTTSRPSSWISRMYDPSGISPGGGSGSVGR